MALTIDIASGHPQTPEAFNHAFCRETRETPEEYQCVRLVRARFLRAQSEEHDEDSDSDDETPKKKSKKKSKTKQEKTKQPGDPTGYDALVVPVICSGDMNRKSAEAVKKYIGGEIETTLKNVIRDDHDGDAPPGTAIVINVRDENPRYVVAVVVMRIYHDISATPQVYYAMRGLLREILRYNEEDRDEDEAPIRSILMPNLGTGTGAMPHFRAHLQLRHAYDAVILKRGAVFEAQQAGKKSVDFQEQAGLHLAMCGVKHPYVMPPAVAPPPTKKKTTKTPKE